jgi:hypothetical protein
MLILRISPEAVGIAGGRSEFIQVEHRLLLQRPDGLLWWAAPALNSLKK